jgi:ribosomal protein L40E
MTLTKFKLCPACGEHNPPALLECRRCETDLTGVEVADAETLAAAGAPAAPAAAPAAGRAPLVKLCDCGAENPPQARKCSVCGEDISDVRAAASAAGSPPARFTLTALEGGGSFPLAQPVAVIGREAEMREYLAAKSYVSRRHAKLTLANGELYIENLSKTNYTFVNNTLIPSGAPTLLRPGDEIGLGGKVVGGGRQAQAAYFVLEAPP